MTQLVHVLHVVPEQHIAEHCAGEPPLIAQRWKHAMLLAQPPGLVSLRQLMVSWQQLPTMHWLHGVPPGSMVQLPASTAMPQWPLTQVRPTQHSELVLQLDPGARQLQVPPTQLFEQHSPG